jgi:putative membrane protein
LWRVYELQVFASLGMTKWKGMMPEGAGEAPLFAGERAADTIHYSCRAVLLFGTVRFATVERSGMQKVRVRMFAVLLTACCTLVFTLTAAAQVESNTSINMKGLGTGQDAAAGKGNPFFDKKFLKKAIEASQDDVAMARLALEKSTTSEVKGCATQEAEDHGKILNGLQHEAQEVSLSVPDGPTKGASKTMEKMKELQGDAFDAAYLHEIVKSHKDEDKSYRSEASTTADPILKNQVTEDDQILAKHLQQADALAAKGEK